MTGHRLGDNPAKHVSDKGLAYSNFKYSSVGEITQLNPQKKILTVHQRWYMDDKKHTEKCSPTFITGKCELKSNEIPLYTC